MEYRNTGQNEPSRPPHAERSNSQSADSVERTITSFIKQLRRRFEIDLARDPKAFKKRVVKLVRRELPPRRGRPNDPRLDAAAQMVGHGKPLKEVLRSQIPNFDKLDTYGRYLAEKGLRAALTRRRRRGTVDV